MTTRLETAIKIIANTVMRGGTVFACGCGGSMAQAQHLVAELTGRFRRERPPIAAIALGSNPAHVSAVANDYGFEHVFARELEALGKPGDMLVALSTSGKSPAVLAACTTAHRLGMPAVLVTVGPGGPLPAGEWARVVEIDSTDTAEIQERTLEWIHFLCQVLDDDHGEGTT